MSDHVKLLLSLVRDAGRITVKLADGITPEFKPDNSVITAADRAVSALAHARLKPLIATGAHILIDEEDPCKGDHFSEAVLERTPYVWAIDPVDGTRVYANHMPHYGISVGLIKDRKPYLGAVYFPAMKELFYCDGTDAWFVKDPFTWKARKTLIKPVDEPLSHNSVFILADDLGKNVAWHSQDCRFMVFSSAVSEFCWPAIGRACGSLSRVYLWDIAGSWPIVERAGLKFRHAGTGQPLERLSISLFQSRQAWKFKDHYILSSERNYPLLRQRSFFRRVSYG